MAEKYAMSRPEYILNIVMNDYHSIDGVELNILVQGTELH